MPPGLPKQHRGRLREAEGDEGARQGAVARALERLSPCRQMALKAGRGFAVKVNPTSDWLQPFSTTVIQLTCFSDLPGFMEDEPRSLRVHCWELGCLLTAPMNV